MTATLSEHLTIREAARRLDVHPDTVRRRVRSGDIRAVRIGAVVRIPVDALTDLPPASSAAPDNRPSTTAIDSGAALGAEHRDVELAGANGIFADSRAPGELGADNEEAR